MGNRLFFVYCTTIDFLVVVFAMLNYYATVRVEIFFHSQFNYKEVCMGKIADQVLQLCKPIAESLGLEIIEVTYEKRYDGMNLTVVIDKEDGVSIDDCEKLHRAIDAPLDELDPIEESYILNVSSPGIDRPLKTERDYRRNLNKKIAVKLYKPLDGSKSFQGVLIDFDENTFTITLQNKNNITFNKQDTAKVEPVIEF